MYKKAASIPCLSDLIASVTVGHTRAVGVANDVAAAVLHKKELAVIDSSDKVEHIISKDDEIVTWTAAMEGATDIEALVTKIGKSFVGADVAGLEHALVRLSHELL